MAARRSRSSYRSSARSAAGSAQANARRGPRLQKVMAEAGVGSRRACEEMIELGMVSVNGTVVRTLPVWVDPENDRILVEGRPIQRQRERKLYVMLNKPRGTVSTNRDPEGRPRAIDLVQHPAGVRLYPVGRLDLDSSGLLLLTNDGELANRLTHPRYEVHKGYEVTVGGRLEEADVARLERGIFLPEHDGTHGRRTARSSLTVLRRDRDRTLLFMLLREGRNRQIRRMLLRLGHAVKKLRRVQMGPVQLKGLQVGEWRELTTKELASLRQAASRLDRAAREAEAGPTRARRSTPRSSRTPGPRSTSSGGRTSGGGRGAAGTGRGGSAGNAAGTRGSRGSARRSSEGRGASPGSTRATDRSRSGRGGNTDGRRTRGTSSSTRGTKRPPRSRGA